MNVAAKFLTTRWAVRLPLVVFELRLGFLFGGRLLMLRHRGRTSGRLRRVVLEAVQRESADSIIVASGFGSEAQWYRNLRADPHCVVSIGRRVDRSAHADLLDAEESARILERYAAQHPRLWASLRRAVEAATGRQDPVIPLVRLRLDGG